MSAFYQLEFEKPLAELDQQIEAAETRLRVESPDANQPSPAEAKDIALLRKLAQAINIGLRSAQTPEDLARQVNAAIEKSDKRRKAKTEAAAIAQAQAPETRL